jgi:WD40 repeat protein
MPRPVWSSPRWAAKEASRSLYAGNRMTDGSSLLQNIVVRIYLDDEVRLGTGFFLKDDLVVTCYHVLEEKDGSLRKCYYIKHDSTGLVAAEPVRSFKPPIDIAILHCHETSPTPINVVIKPWDNQGKDEFLTRGYDINTPQSEGASNEEGEIVARGTLEGEVRLQLRTEKETLLQGRSGSPIWSKRQQALVGMIDYRSGQESTTREKSFAIPLNVLGQLGIEIHPESQLFNVPSLPPNFIPRSADLEKVKEAILAEAGSNAAITGTYRSIGLQGMGGIGKSIMAVALARDEQIRRVFNDGIFWIRLGHQAELLQSQIKLISALEPGHGSIATTADGRDELRRILNHKCCLIILDDIWRMEQLQAFDGLGSGCRMLLTTRDEGIVRNSGAIECRLGVLKDSEAKELLKLWSGKHGLSPDALEVAKECDNLPLALAMVGAMVKGRPDDRWGNVLHKLRSADLEKIQAEFMDYPYPNLMRAIEISTDDLGADQRKLYLDLAVFLEDEQVPEGALQVLWNTDRYDTQDLIDLFVDRSLATLKDGRLSVHDLQHDFMTKRAGNLLKLHEKLLEGYKSRCSGGWATGPNDGYFFQHLAYHLSQAGKESDLRALLLDFDWMQARLQAADVAGLIHDFDFLPSHEDIQTIQGAIRLSAHVLFRDASQLPGQLLGRLMELGLPNIQSLLERMPSRVQGPWIRPLARSLIPPGGPLIRTLRGHIGPIRGVAVTPDGKKAVSGSGDNSLKVWDLESGREIRTLRGHTGQVWAVAVTSDGKKAVSGSWDNTIKVWDLESGREIQTLSGHTGQVWAVVVTPDGKKVVSGSADRTLRVWDLESGREIQTLQGHTGAVGAVAVTPDGKKAVSGSGDNTIKVWNLESGREIQTIWGPYSVKAVAITPDGKKAVSGSADRTLKVWDLEGGREIQTLQGHAGKVFRVVITPDGKKAVSGSADRTLKVWDLESGREIQTLQGHTGKVFRVVITPDGEKAVSGSDDRTLKIWNLESGREIQTLRGHTGPVRGVAVAPDGKRVVSRSDDRTLKVWDLESGREIQTLQGHTGPIWAAVVTPDCRKAISGSVDCTLGVWDLESGREIQILQGHTGKVFTVAITPDGKKAVSGSWDHTIKVWNLESGREIQTLQGHAGIVMNVAVTPDGKKAVSGSADRTLKVWDLESGREIQALQGHTGPVRAVAITSDGKKAVSRSDDSTLKIWDLESGRLMVEFTGDGAINSIALSPDGRTVIAGDVLGRVHFLRLENLGSPPITRCFSQEPLPSS